MSQPAFFCINPFICTRQNSYNRISPCPFGPVEINVTEDTTQSKRWHHPILTAFRTKFLAGEKPSECKRCWDEENAGIPSLRQRSNNANPNAYVDSVLTGAWKLGPQEVVLKTTNVCNLACRSCAGWDSSYFWPEGEFYTNNYNTKKINPKGTLVAGNDYTRSRDKVYHRSDLWTTADLSQIKKFNFFGGEPLLDKQHRLILERLISNGRAKDVTLFYSTNTQQIASHLEHLWKHFKRIEIFFSIDGIEDQFEYLRWPGKWSKTLDTISWFKNLEIKYPNVDWYFQGSQCVSILNISDYWKTSNWLKENLGAVYFNIVDHPPHLRMTQIPDENKKLIYDKIPDDGIKNYFMSEQSNPDLLKKMIIWTRRMDLYRNQDFTKTFPETYNLIKDAWEQYKDDLVDP